MAPSLCSAGEAVLLQFAPAPNAQVTHRGNLPDGNYLPWFSVPSRFLFTGNYYAHLSRVEMRIDHVASDSRCTRQNRTFMISASYAQPIGLMGSSRFDIPLVSADRFDVTRLAPASVGDYVVHLSDNRVYNPALYLLLTARF